MHRHGYSGRKFGRKRDQRTALMRGLATSLLEYEAIETTLPKAKEVIPFVEKLITKAKNPTLHNRRQIISKLNSVPAGNKLVDDIAPKLTGRDSGHLRITKTGTRRGDQAALARVSFVDSLEKKIQPKAAAAKKTATKAPVAKKKTATKTEGAKK